MGRPSHRFACPKLGLLLIPSSWAVYLNGAPRIIRGVYNIFQIFHGLPVSTT